MRGVVVAVVLMLTGCIKPSGIQNCGDQVCPDTQVCIDEQRCVASASLEACATAAAGASCTAGGVIGRCTPHNSGAVTVCDPAVCGDNVIDDALHEQCDGTAPITEQCVDLGFDLGRPTCSAQCGLDVLGCTRFGWDTVVNAPVISFWTDGTTIAYSRRNPDRLEITGAFTLSVPGFYSNVIGGGGHIFVRGNEDLFEATPNGLVSLASPFDAQYAETPVAGDDGSMYVQFACAMWRWQAGVWKNLAASQPQCFAHIAVGPAAKGGRVFVNNGYTIYELADDTYKVAKVLNSSENVNDLEVSTVAGKDLLLIATEQNLYGMPMDGSPMMTIYSGYVNSVAATSAFVYGTTIDSTRGIRWDGRHIDQLALPSPTLFDDGKGHLYAAGGPVYRFSGLAFGTLGNLPFNTPDDAAGILQLPDGDVVVATAYELLNPDPISNGWQGIGSPISPNAIRALGGNALNHRIISGYIQSGGVPDIGSIWREDTPFAFESVGPPIQAFVDGLWMDAAGNSFAAGRYGDGKGFLGKLPAASTTWDIFSPPSCELHGIDALTPTAIVAVGACDGVAVLWTYNGASWSELHREPSITTPLYAVHVLPSGDIFAAGDTGAVWQTAGLWHVDPAVRGRSMSGTDGDVWLAGAFTQLQHWDGTQWSEMTTRALGNTVVAASRARILMPGAAPGHVVLLRDP